jgi:hypothetical protein
MAIEVVVFDVSDTLLETVGGRGHTCTTTPRADVPYMLEQLVIQGVQVVAVSNNPVRAQLSASGLAQYIDHIIERKDVGAPKGNPVWVRKLEELTGVRPHQMFYVGDSRFDMITATRGPMIYAHAMWAGPPLQYGLRAESPRWVANVIRHIFCRQHPWFWTLDTMDAAGRSVRAMTLIDGNGAGSDNTKQALIDLLKEDRDRTIPGTPVMLSQFVMLHMLASVYHDNLIGEADIWTTYPGHTGTPNAIMGDFIDVAAKLSRDSYKEDLFDRHTPALRSREARARGDVFALENQIGTVRLSDAYRGRLKGKRVLLLDNFLTAGYTTEGGRNLLLAAGASDVIVACVGKYGDRMRTIAPVEAEWDPFTTERPPASSFVQLPRSGTRHSVALEEFTNSLNRIHQADWGDMGP